MYDIIIIGGGCAGLSAAIYGARAGKSVAVFESGSIGGQITSAHLVENYPGIPCVTGVDFADRIYNQALSYGAEVRPEEVQKVTDNGKLKQVFTDEGTYETGAVIIATGVKHRHLGLDREEELTGRGVSYCAICDGAFYKDKVVAVAGGGNTAIGDAIFLSGYCRKVYVIHRRDTLRAQKHLVDTAKGRHNIEFVFDTEVEKLNGEDKLNGLMLKNKSTGMQGSLSVEGLFIAVGYIPVNGMFSEMGILDDSGYIIADETGKTKLPGIFAAGDCRSKGVRQLATAAADGINAVLSAMGEQ